jgi:predicted MPP superfamily phosphohydrolase
MSDMVNVLHLTDLHFGMEGHAHVSQTAIAQRTNALNSLLARLQALEPEWRPQIVVVSGDIGWRGSSSDYAQAKPFIAKVLDAVGLGPDRFLMCAGNHDIDRSATRGMLPPPSAEYADDWLRVENLANLLRPFKAYAEACVEFGAPVLRIGDTAHAVIGQHELLGIRLVSLNSAWFCRGDDDKGHLWIGLPQLELMHSYEQLANPDAYDDSPITIILVHHPPSDLNEAENNSYGDRPATYRYLAERAHLIFSGHVHGAVEHPTRHYQRAFGIVGGASYAGGRYRNNVSILRIALRERHVWRRAFELDPRFAKWEEVRGGDFSLRLKPQHRPAGKGSAFTTNPVRFATETRSDQFDLQRAIHQIVERDDDDEPVLIPFVFDSQIEQLLARVKGRYDSYQNVPGLASDHVKIRDFDSLNDRIIRATKIMRNLPEKIARSARHINTNSCLRRSNLWIAQACSRLVQLLLTHTISTLSPYQLASDDPIFFEDYIGKTSLDAIIAKIDNVSVDEIVKYILVNHEKGEQVECYAPIDYGRGRMWLLSDIEGSVLPYSPPIPFLTDYVLPQLFAWTEKMPEDWRMEARCHDIFVKDRDGEYISCSDI